MTLLKLKRRKKVNKDSFIFKPNLFLFLAFLLPTIIRAIPEAIMAPYVTGFDIMAHYVPTTHLWLSGDIGFAAFLGTAPLFYSIVVLLVSSGGALITVLKVLPPILHGFLGLSIYGFAKLGLGWTPKKSLAVTLLATLFFVSLRISWDMLRNELALIMFFVVLTLLSSEKLFSKQWKRYLLLSFAFSLVVLAHQLVSVIMFGVIALTIVHSLVKRKRSDVPRLLVAALPAFLVLLGLFFLSPQVSEFRLIFGFGEQDGWLELFGYSSYTSMLVDAIGFFLFCFLPLLPLAVFGAKNLRNFQLRSWLILSVVIALIPMVSPSNLRWVMMLTYPLAFFAVEGLSRLRVVASKRFKVAFFRFVSAYFVVLAFLSVGFMLLPPEQPLFYFNYQLCNGYVYQMPTSMLQNTVSINDCSDVTKALQWVRLNMNQSDVLLSHRAFYGWALSELNKDQVILYEYDNPVEIAQSMLAEHRRVFLVWWADGQGWYGQQSIDSYFNEVFSSGKIAVYVYNER